MPSGTVVKRPSGAFAIVYRVNGRQVWETVGRSRREAERLLDERKHELRAGTWLHPRDRNRAPAADEAELTLRAYAERWLERQDPARVQAPKDGRFARRRIAASTFDTYRRDLRGHVLPALGDKPLAALTTDDVDGLIAGLEAKGRAPETIRNVVIPLRRLLGDAVRQGVISTNPASRCDLPPGQDFRGQEIAPDHCRAIRQALVELAPVDRLRGEPDLFYACLFDVALGTGLRLGELRALRWRDVDFERRLIRVARAYSRNELTRPKSEAGVRSVPLFPSVASAFEELAARALARRRFADDELVFATARGTPLHGSNLSRRVWRKALEKAKLLDTGYRWHDLRHTAVSRLVAAGADVALVQAIAGHSDPRLTLKRYTHLRDARITEAATRFEAVFGG